MNTPMELSDREFSMIASLIHQQFGIYLSPQKQALIVGRLRKLVAQLGFSSFEDYCAHVRDDATGSALAELANRITTHHTFFYREKAHFDFFAQKVLPECASAARRANSRDLRIWCAGCATGEEAYTLDMLLHEYFGREYSLWDGGVLATDLAANVLERARRGIYAGERLRHLPEHLRQLYVERRGEDSWQVVEAVRRDVLFRRFNLLTGRLPFRKPFDVIFCRNVMIYFDAEIRERTARCLSLALRPGGYLFIGHSETLHQLDCPVDFVQPGVYRRQVT